jgi:ketosteroid isomerase-like protein
MNSRCRDAVIGALCAIALLGVVGCTTKSQTPATPTVIGLERQALDRWGHGDPGGFLDTYADDVTYFDPAQNQRVDGRPAMQKVLAPVAGKIAIRRFEMLRPLVQQYDDVAILTYNLVNYTSDTSGGESVLNRWNSTSVYRRQASGWRVVHSHWSLTTPAATSR